MRSRSIAMAVSLLAAACVTVYEDAPLIESGDLSVPEFAVAQTIPIAGAGTAPADRVLYQYYGSILERMQEAAKERNVQALFALLDGNEKPNLPDWIAERLRGYRALGHGLAFLEHAAAHAEIRLIAATPDGSELARPAAVTPPTPSVPPIGEPVRFEFALPAGPNPVVLGGGDGDDPIGFAIAMTIEDQFVDGSRRDVTKQDFHWLDSAFELSGAAVLRRPYALEIPAGEAVRRNIHLRIDLLPGYVMSGEFRAPVQRRALAATTVTQWPRGYEPIVAQPLATLREALRLGDKGHYAHVFLGASFTTGPDREAAIDLLAEQVRYGTPPQAIVAMATLRSITDLDITVGDREAWLAWFASRR
ncbi:MAG: hypothetical protein KDC98_15455 [Planctomycetes bacterium]|nr:hypothetical protein [Planctomycetota bacterium]